MLGCNQTRFKDRSHEYRSITWLVFQHVGPFFTPVFPSSLLLDICSALALAWGHSSFTCISQVSTVQLSTLRSSICLVLSDEWGAAMSQPLEQQKILICALLKVIFFNNWCLEKSSVAFFFFFFLHQVSIIVSGKAEPPQPVCLLLQTLAVT